MFAKQYQVALPQYASQAELIAALYDESGSKDWQVRRKLFSKLPDSFAIEVAKEYAENFKLGGRDIANALLQDIVDELKTSPIGAGSSDDDIIHYAKRKAQEFSRLRYQFINQARSVQVLCDIAFHRYGVIPPLRSRLGSSEIPVTVTVPGTENAVTVTVSVTGVLNRLCDERWWRRSLRNVTIRNVEAKAIQLGLVRNVTKYVSNDTFERICKQKRRNRKTLEQTFATNELNQEFSLQELSDLSVSNPKNMRNELMTRFAGFDAIALQLGHIGKVYTITCPSRMHARHKQSDTKNRKYDNTTPRQAQEYLNTVWKRIRAQLARDGIYLYGFRTLEPHQDATPHWHLLAYMPPEHAKRTDEVFRKYALEDSPDEKGAQEHRLNVITIDRKKGTGVSYMAKYISKGIDGHGLDTDIDGSLLGNGPERLKAWLVTWGARQFQQIGGPPVTVWRELRKISGDGLTGIAKEVWQSANDGKWDEYTMLMGGPLARRKDFPISLAKQWSDEPNRYQEPKGNEIIGVSYGNVLVPTKLHQWTIQYRPDKNRIGGGSIGTPLDGSNGPPSSTPPIGTPTNGSPLASILNLGFKGP